MRLGEAWGFTLYSRGVDGPRLRLVGVGASREGRGALGVREVTERERRAVLQRLEGFLAQRPARLMGTELRLLDFSPAGVPVHAALAGEGVRVTRLAESEVAGELIREADPGAVVLVCGLDELSTRLSPGAFDAAHTAVTLGHRRELPMLAALTALARQAGSGFVWTDRVAQSERLGARRVREIAGRVDLGRCGVKRGLGSGLFTLSGWW